MNPDRLSMDRLQVRLWYPWYRFRHQDRLMGQRLGCGKKFACT